jgi:hypothetical protein
MLSRKDKEFIREAIKEALTLEVDYEKVRDERTGQPLAKPERIKREIYIPAWIIEYLPYTEGALRGLQETVDKADNRRLNQYDTIVNVLLTAENTLKTLAACSDKLKSLEHTEPKLIEVDNEDTDT